VGGFAARGAAGEIEKGSKSPSCRKERGKDGAPAVDPLLAGWQRIPFDFAQGRLSCLASLARRNDKGEEVAGGMTRSPRRLGNAI
jgi:hypothetical protein